MSTRKWFQSVDKCGRRQPFDFHLKFVASPPKPLEEFCRNLAYEFLSMSRYVRPKMMSGCQKKKKINNNNNLFIALSSDLLELYCQEFVYTI